MYTITQAHATHLRAFFRAQKGLLLASLKAFLFCGGRDSAMAYLS